MIQVAFYEPSTGRILSTGTAQSEALALAEAQSNGFAVVLHCAQDVKPSTHHVDGGECHRLPFRPADHHTFDYATKQWVANPEAAWDAVKRQRSQLLADSDWRVTKAAESGASIPIEWATYRQALRDITQQTDPWNIIWPESP